jgi:hypothetical protein
MSRPPRHPRKVKRFADPKPRLHQAFLMSVLRCSKCDAEATVLCDCGVAYIPAGTRALQVVAANPDKTIVGKSSPLHSTKIEPHKPSDEQTYIHNISEMASETIALKARLHRTYGDKWKEFTVTSDVKMLVQQAADAWNEFNQHIQNQG